MTGSTMSLASTARVDDDVTCGEEHRVNDLAYGTFHTLVNTFLHTGIRQTEERPIEFIEYTQANVENRTGMVQKDSDTLLVVDGWKASEHGMKFYRNENGTMWTRGLGGVVPAEYISSIMDLKTGKMISCNKRRRPRSPARRQHCSYKSVESDSSRSRSCAPHNVKRAEKTKVSRYTGAEQSMRDSTVFTHARVSILPRKKTDRRRRRSPRCPTSAATKMVVKQSKKTLEELRKLKIQHRKLKERLARMERDKIKRPVPAPPGGNVHVLKKRGPVAYIPPALRQREVHGKQQVKDSEARVMTTVWLCRLPKRTSVLPR